MKAAQRFCESKFLSSSVMRMIRYILLGCYNLSRKDLHIGIEKMTFEYILLLPYYAYSHLYPSFEG